MPQVKYIAQGVKVDSIRGVGLRWEPGQVRNVSAEVAERLLVYVDTWTPVDNVDSNQEPDNTEKKDVDTTSTQAEEIGLSTEEKAVEEPLPVVDFHAMDKDALIKFAETKYNERLDKRKNEETIRHRVIALFGKHETDN
ncbi:hypothetical protein [Nitrosovibrio sp. Nv4]|uniref:hypothetical protein n=1 Tax=Nitrosovibrio sp. Nv4 TaxID=1945880 RepID=UPI000BD3F817|nr:hypothetical protein [Nitrosovibrio sp. Nv4]SOD42373.1 hypothetical protein SAMN06298226_2712 [Nitrosovibrio sp. Nv4]